MLSASGFPLLQYSQCSWKLDVLSERPWPVWDIDRAHLLLIKKSTNGLPRVWEGVRWDYMRWKWLIGHSVWGCQRSLERGGCGGLWIAGHEFMRCMPCARLVCCVPRCPCTCKLESFVYYSVGTHYHLFSGRASDCERLSRVLCWCE